MGNFSKKDSLGNQGWWKIVSYLIYIGDFKAAIRLSHPRTIIELEEAKKKAEKE